MKKIFLFFFLVPMLSRAQTNTGIQFSNERSWQQIVSEAQSGYKYIFVNLVTKACHECDQMKESVYSLENVGGFVNNEMISLNINLDSPSDSIVRGCPVYDKTFREKYKITSTPAYLFFSPDGKLVHRDRDIKAPDNFLQLTYDALDQTTQYYTQLDGYNNGKRDYPLLASIALTAQRLGDKDTANIIAADYLHNYLEKLSSDSELCLFANVDFAARFAQLLTTSDRYFRVLSDMPSVIDRETYPGCANKFVRYLIAKEEIDPKLWPNGEPVKAIPDWNALKRIIEEKYGASYVSIVQNAEVAYYRKIKDWKQYMSLVEEQWKEHPPKPGEGFSGDPWNLNGQAWDIFVNCMDPLVLKKALELSDLSINLQPDNVQYMDTKANLLYKLGRTNEAIAVEKKAIDQGIVNARRRGLDKGDFFDDYTATVAKMQKGEPTWSAK